MSRPIPESELPERVKRVVSKDLPLKQRLMTAKGASPFKPPEMVMAFYQLLFDPEETVRQTALDSLGKLSDKILEAAVRAELPAPVFEYLAEQLLHHRPGLLEPLVLNPAVPDQVLEALARVVDGHVLEIIASNQVRILKDPAIASAVLSNPNTSAALRMSVLEFAARSGIAVEAGDDTQDGQAGEQAGAEGSQEAGDAGQDYDLEFSADMIDESAEWDDYRRPNIEEILARMSVAERKALARKGNRRVRAVLVRDKNKEVALEVLSNPRLTDQERVNISADRSVLKDVLEHAASDKEFTKIYKVKVNLVMNPKTPVAVSMKLLPFLKDGDLRKVARNKNIPSEVAAAARRLLDKRRG